MVRSPGWSRAFCVRAGNTQAYRPNRVISIIAMAVRLRFQSAAEMCVVLYQTISSQRDVISFSGGLQNSDIVYKCAKFAGVPVKPLSGKSQQYCCAKLAKQRTPENRIYPMRRLPMS